MSLATAPRLRALQARVTRVEERRAPLAVASAVELATAAGLALDDWQRAALTSTALRALWNVTRRGGKSTTAALLALWTVLSQPGALVLILSPSEDQSRELFRRAIAAYRALGRPLPADAETTLSLELANGSRLHAMPCNEKTVRSKSAVRLLVIDEAALVPDALYHALTPMVAVSGGRIVALSTPHGRRGWWFTSWESGGNDWERVRVPATSCPRIPVAFLEQERRSMPAWVFESEYLTVFADTGDQLFFHEAVTRMVVAGTRPLFGVQGEAWAS